jgi:polysaccharide biosynthesis transport protein
MKRSCVLALLAGSACLAGGCGLIERTFQPPAASAKITVRDLREVAGSGSAAARQQEFLQNEAEAILSRTILCTVVSNLDLQAAWATEAGPMTMEEAVRRVARETKVARYRDTSLLSIEVRDPEPEQSSRIANEIAAAYRDSRIAFERRTVRRAIEVVENELSRQEAKVDEAEKKLEEIRAQMGVPAWELAIEYSPERIGALKKDLVTTRVILEERKSRAERVDAMSDAELAAAVPQMFTNLPPSVFQGPAGEISEGLAAALQDLRKEVRAEFELARAKLEMLEAELADAAKRNDPAEKARFQPMKDAQRNVEIQRQILNALRARIAQEQIELEVPRTPVEIVDPAEPPRR